MANEGPWVSGKPYPAQWERHDRLRDGTALLVRPLKPEDTALYPDFLAHLTKEDLRLRFLAPLREVSDQMLARLTHLDYATAMAFVAIEAATGKMLGVVRLHKEASGANGEYAVTVKGHGLGWLLMQRIIEYARAEGLQEIHGEVLAENTTMLTMCGELGFHIADDPTERGVKRVTLALATIPAKAP
jgi:N-acetylglutamate synthase-like GNAT family acetyltransferase